MVVGIYGLRGESSDDAARWWKGQVHRRGTEDSEEARVERDHLTNAVIGAATAVHGEIGPGLLASAHQACLAVALECRGIQAVREVPVPIGYRSRRVDAAYRLDFIVEGTLILEIKAVDRLHPIHTAQVLT
jgi:GxxExxY protein